MDITKRVAAFADLEEARASVDNAYHILHEARDERLQALYTIALQTEGNVELRNASIRELYWSPDINTKMLKEAFGLRQNDITLIAVKDHVMTFTCPECNQEVSRPITSKTQLKTYQQDDSMGRLYRRCDECTQKRDQSFQDKQDARQRRLYELRTMPYQAYLQTPEWEETRKTHLRRARHRCQVCNAGNTQLNVHHRTYERRGNEETRDLIVLCRECHYIFHKQGKLQG